VSDDVYKIIRQEHKEAILVTHDISEAIAMVDRAIILCKRPAKVKSIHDIVLTIEGEKSPLTARKAPEFKDYFNILWKELDYNEEKG
ncbi:MAG TPA: ABC transporter ATP-binding protein, partial [Epulopiscium sp.]|nr:ABC transporter ATP-binding protein [Candidatus Epulonipiscium sp.]